MILEQQKLIQTKTTLLKANNIIDKINHQANQFHSLIHQIRGNKPNIQCCFQNQQSLSNIIPKSQKTDSDVYLPFIKNTKNTVKNIRSIDHGDTALKYKNKPYIQAPSTQVLKHLQAAVQTPKESQRSDNNRNMSDIVDKKSRSSLNPQKKHELRIKKNGNTSQIKHTARSSRSNQYQRASKNSFVLEQTANKNNYIFFLQDKIQNMNKPTLESTADQTYDFFDQIYIMHRIERVKEPLIKRYKNCVYFGQKIPRCRQKYSGMVWYYRGALYFGEFQVGKKNGKGTELDVRSGHEGVVWRGNFQKGAKKGYMEIFSPHFTYHGVVRDGLYHGEGVLITNLSTYRGKFQTGLKQGYGQEQFSKNHVEYRGYYHHGKFHGQGQLYSDNYYYKGTFKSNKAHGNGCERAKDYQYVGEFQNGQKDGYGVIKSDEVILEGEFKKGNIIREVKSKTIRNQQCEREEKHINNVNNKDSKKEPIIKTHLFKLECLNEKNEEGTIDHEKGSAHKHPGQMAALSKGTHPEYDCNDEEPLQQKVWLQ